MDTKSNKNTIDEDVLDYQNNCNETANSNITLWTLNILAFVVAFIYVYTR